MSIKEFKTIDIEGDGLAAAINQKLFPEGNHFDPGTIIWCVTVCDQDYNTITFVHKLPDTPRPVKDGYSTKAVHYKSSKVPESVDGHKVIEYTNMKDFLRDICSEIYGSKVYCKGYVSGNTVYNYDRTVLDANIDRYGCIGHTVTRNIEAVRVDNWKRTYSQIKPGQWIDNQTYMINGIRHNIEDAVQLAEKINNGECEM
jgi:hypothetical protein